MEQVMLPVNGYYICLTVTKCRVLIPPVAAQQMEHYGRLPLHYNILRCIMISTSIQACCAGAEDPLLEMVEILGYFVQ
jgi:hypothetical protein